LPRIIADALTQKIIDNTTLPKTGRTVLRDPDQKGLSLRILPSGAKSWSFEYRSPITAKNVRLTLPTGSLMDARATAREMRVAVAQGRDPALDVKQALIARQAAHSSRQTVADALDKYETAVVTPAARVVSRRARMSALRKAMTPFNDMAVADLKRAAIVTRLDEIHSTRGPVEG
jgi:hypothetical protein